MSFDVVSLMDPYNPFMVWTDDLGRKTWSFDGDGHKQLFDDEKTAFKAYLAHVEKEDA